MQQTLGDPAFRHEQALWSLEAPPGPEHGVLWETRLSSWLQSPITFSADGSHFVFHQEEQFEVLRSDDGTRVLRWPRRQGEAWALGSHQQLFLSDREDGLQRWDLRCGLLKAFNPETKTHKLVLSPCERFLACLATRRVSGLIRVGRSCSEMGVGLFDGTGPAERSHRRYEGLTRWFPVGPGRVELGNRALGPRRSPTTRARVRGSLRDNLGERQRLAISTAG